MGVSLVAVAAIATSLLLTRRPDRDPVVRAAGNNAPTQQPLDKIREAGL